MWSFSCVFLGESRSTVLNATKAEDRGHKQTRKRRLATVKA